MVLGMNEEKINIDKITKAVSLSDIITPLSKSIAENTLLQSQEIIKNTISPIQDIIKQVADMQKGIIDSIGKMVKNSVSPSLNSLSIAIQEAKKNPDSRLSWMNYYEKMTNYFWIIPYQMETQQLHDLLEIIDNEKEFDRYLLKYFNKKRTENLFIDIEKMLPNQKSRTIFRQITNTYNNKDYILSNMGIISMIDDLFTFFLINKGCTYRNNLFKTIAMDLDNKNENTDLLYIVMMVNSNINLLYERVEFNGKITIKTNKKSRRMSFAHGKAYSNKRVDAIMLLNTLYYLLILRESLKEYKDCLYKDRNNVFHIATKEKRREIRKSLKII